MDAKKLARLHRVRTLQLGLVQAEEARAHDRYRSEELLNARIVALADAVAPAPSTAGGFSFAAAAHFRDRLHQSAAAARGRLAAAEAQAGAATEATRSARRDQSAIEKLIARADAATTLKEMRALEEAPPARGKTAR